MLVSGLQAHPSKSRDGAAFNTGPSTTLLIPFQADMLALGFANMRPAASVIFPAVSYTGLLPSGNRWASFCGNEMPGISPSVSILPSHTPHNENAKHTTQRCPISSHLEPMTYG